MNKDVKIAEKESPFRICVISFPMPSAIVVNTFVCNLIEVLEPICEKVYVVTSNIPKDKTFSEKVRLQDVKTAMHFRDTICPRWWSTLLQFFKIIIIQLKMCWVLVKISKEIDIVIFYVGGANLFPAVLMAKVLRKKVVTLAIGTSFSNKEALDKKLFGIGGVLPSAFGSLERTIFSLSDQIIVDINVESEYLIREFGLEKYRHKVSFGGALPLDTNSFGIKKKLKDRRNIIGYIGRHSPEKGVMNLARAIPLILKERNDSEFLICGGGILFEEIKDELKKSGSCDKVTFTGWVPREKLPDYFNKLKLIVVPSYIETIPNVIMEAMACGTPIVAAPAVAIPDLIRDGKNGFLMENNSPECIAKNVIRALDDSRLEEIVKNAYNLIHREYTYEVVVENYRKLLMKKE